MYTVDIHSHNETIPDALALTEAAITAARRDKDRILCLITGYGSTSGHHRIKDAVLEYLDSRVGHGIRGYILGSHLDIFDPVYQSFPYSALIPESEKKHPNPGAVYVIV